MISFEEYRRRVYVKLMDEYLLGISREEKEKYFKSNSAFIKKAYNDDVFMYKNIYKTDFKDSSIAAVCWNLAMLY